MNSLLWLQLLYNSQLMRAEGVGARGWGTNDVGGLSILRGGRRCRLLMKLFHF
jgi:hypothetical protein